jgi:membrane fusion protein, heavy metal efflux system
MMTRDLRRVVAVVLLSAHALVASTVEASPGAHGPNGEHLEGATTTGASGLMRLPDGSLNVPKLAQRRMGLRTQLIPLSAAPVTVQMSGQVVVDPNAGGRVQAVHGGRIEPGPTGLPVAGQAVRKGHVLAYLRHHADPYAEANQKSEQAELRASRAIPGA